MRSFSLLGVVLLAGCVIEACSSTSTVAYGEGDGGTPRDGASATQREGGAPLPVTCELPNGGSPAKTSQPPGPIGNDAGDRVPSEEGTVGILCKSDQDCDVAGSVGDNVCSIGFFTVGDMFTDAVCVSMCRRGAGGGFADILCDGNSAATSPGVCLADNPGDTGPCLPACEFGSSQIDTKCAGTNQCGSSYFGTAADGTAFALGICLGACRSDADCKGSSGCQVETGLCVTNPIAYTKKTGQGCNGAAAPDECNCNTVGGSGANRDRGYCTHHCLTGSCGDDLCDALVKGWRCSAGLPTKFADGKPGFTGQPANILGTCALPCASDADCAPLSTTIGGGVTLKCEATAGFKICVASN